MAGTPTEFEPVPPDVAAHPTVKLPRQRTRPTRRRAPVWLAAAVTTVWAAAVSYLPVLGLVMLLGQVSGGAPIGARLTFGTAFWLLAHGVPLSLGGDRLALVPLAVSVLAAWRVSRAGVHTARAIGARTAGRALLSAFAVATVYAGLGALAANLARPLAVPVESALRLGGFALVFAGLGAARESRSLGRLARRLPLPVRDGLRTGTVAAFLVLGAGAAVAGVAVAVSGGQASATLATFHAGVLGQAALTLVCLVYAPNLATWSAAYLIGPGFAVGAGTTVSAGKVSLGALPAVPVLAALPDSAVSGLGPLLRVLPMAGGMAAGWLLVRRRLRLAAERESPTPGWGELIGICALAGPVGGVVLGLSAWASGGALGAGRLAVMGPVGWSVGVVAAGVLAFGALLAAVATRVLIRGRS
ncbi:MAG: hypothetical protein E6G35_12055 [Actinobacteria bacterium]|nr:MAG: hypothetical protein E6G35_12055 [Actinomycetota bacterium]